jgi:predicted permease
MRWLRGIAHRIKMLSAKSREERELDEEIQFHLEQDIARNVAAGMHVVEARRQALLRFGGVENTKEQVRDETGVRWVADVIQDVRFALRSLRKTPVFAAVALASLGIGVGANTAIFSVVNGVLLQPLQYPSAERIHLIRIDNRRYTAPLSAADFLRWTEASDAPVSLAGWGTHGFTMMTENGAEVVNGAWVTSGIFDVFGVSPIIGRSFTTVDDLAVVLSHRFWRSHLGGTSDIVGQTLELDGQRYTIVGVMSQDFRLPGRAPGGIWALRRISEPTRRGPFFIRAAARLDRGKGTERLEQHMRMVEGLVKERYSGSTAEWEYVALPLKDILVAGARPTLFLLLAAVGCVLLIAVANVTNLLLARATVREHEIALRSALGASRNRLVRQTLTESAVLGVLGALFGIALAWACVEALGAAASSFVPRMDEVSIDGWVLTFGLLAGVAAALVAGAVPALSVPRYRLSEVLSEGGRGRTAGVRRGTVRRALVVGEFALASSVLIVSGLVVKSLVRLQSADLGIDGVGVVTFVPSLPSDPYSSPDVWDSFFATLEERLRALPGVREVGYSSSLPPDRLNVTNNYVVEGEEPTPDGNQPLAEWIPVSERYFATLDIPLLRGRSFAHTDRDGEPEVVVVNEAFARRHFPDRDPLGGRLKGGNLDPSKPWMTIVGVVGDVAYAGGAAEGMSPTVYTAYRQSPRSRTPYVLVRATGDLDAVMPQIRAELTALEPRAPILGVATMEQLIWASTSTERARSSLLSVMALLALIPAATGVFGVLSYHVSLRRRETALRRALGGPSTRLVGAVIGEGLRLVVIGVAVGFAGALAVARGLTTMLYEVGPADMTVYVGASAVLFAVAVLACLVPSISVLRLDPVAALREE